MLSWTRASDLSSLGPTSLWWLSSSTRSSKPDPKTSALTGLFLLFRILIILHLAVKSDYLSRGSFLHCHYPFNHDLFLLQIEKLKSVGSFFISLLPLFVSILPSLSFLPSLLPPLQYVSDPLPDETPAGWFLICQVVPLRAFYLVLCSTPTPLFVRKPVDLGKDESYPISSFLHLSRLLFWTSTKRGS